MTSLQENVLLTKVFLYNSPLYAIGILGCFYPWIYAFVPVHASEICLCSFYYKKVTDIRNYLFLTNDLYGTLELIN